MMKPYLPTVFAVALAVRCIAGEPQTPSDTTAVAQSTPGAYYETITLEEPLGVGWDPQMVEVPVRFSHRCHPESLTLFDSTDAEVTFQVTEPVYEKEFLRQCSIAFISGLGPSERVSCRLYYDETEPEKRKKPRRKKGEPAPLYYKETLLKSVLTTRRVSVRFLGAAGRPKSPLPPAAAPAPIDAIRGADGVWRGRGELLSPFKMKSWRTDVLAEGPVFARARIRCDFTEGHHYELTLTAVADSDWITISEDFDMGARSCFMLRSPNCRSEEIRKGPFQRTANVFSRLPAHYQKGATIGGQPAKRFESVASPDGTDLFAVFSVQPGQWENPIGSEINFIQLKSCLLFHFPLEKGTRSWGLHATTLAEGTSRSVYRTVKRASDAPLDTVLKMEPAKGEKLVLIKRPQPDCDELVEIAQGVSAAVNAVLDQGFSGPPCQALDPSRVGCAARIYRRLKAGGKIDTPSADALRARLAFLGAVFHDPSFYAWHILLQDDLPPGANFDAGSIDWLRNIQRFSALAEVAAALPDHPSADEWMGHAQSQFALTIKHLISPWGLWCDGDSTHEQAARLLEQLSDTLRAAGGRDFSDAPAFEAMIKYRPVRE